jgi:hypothetical protein
MSRAQRIAVSVAIGTIVSCLNIVGVAYLSIDSKVINNGRSNRILEALIFPLCDLDGSGHQPVFANCLLSGVIFGVVAIFVLAKPHHFSLRTLLIVTTLVAVVLGLAAWEAS